MGVQYKTITDTKVSDQQRSSDTILGAIYKFSPLWKRLTRAMKERTMDDSVRAQSQLVENATRPHRRGADFAVYQLRKTAE